MALSSMKQEAQDNSGVSCGSDVYTKNGRGPGGPLHYRAVDASRPMSALGNIASVDLHPMDRASLSVFPAVPSYGGVSKQRISNRNSGAMVLLARL